MDSVKEPLWVVVEKSQGGWPWPGNSQFSASWRNLPSFAVSWGPLLWNRGCRRQGISSLWRSSRFGDRTERIRQPTRRSPTRKIPLFC